MYLFMVGYNCPKSDGNSNTEEALMSFEDRRKDCCLTGNHWLQEGYLTDDVPKGGIASDVKQVNFHAIHTQMIKLIM